MDALDSKEELNQDIDDFVEDLDELDKDQVAVPPVDPREQENQDEEMFLAVNSDFPICSRLWWFQVKLFFSNEFEKAETIFKSKSLIDPLYALGLGSILLIKALMTFDDHHIQTATSFLQRTEQIASVQTQRYEDPISLGSVVAGTVGVAGAAVGSILKFGGFFSSTPDEPKPRVLMMNGEFRATIIKAESNLLEALLHLFQESILGFVRAGLKIRQGYKSYSKAWTEYLKLKENELDHYDLHSVVGVQFGYVFENFEARI